MIVHTLFNKHQRKYRKRNCRKRKRTINLAALATQIDNLLSAYKSYFMYNFKCLILSLANKHMIALSHNWLTLNVVPERIAVLTKDLIAYKKRSPRTESTCIEVGRGSTNSSSFMTVRYHNKEIEMINLPTLLHSKTVRDTVPHFLDNRKPPMVSYTYTNYFRQDFQSEESDRGIGF